MPQQAYLIVVATALTWLKYAQEHNVPIDTINQCYFSRDQMTKLVKVVNNTHKRHNIERKVSQPEDENHIALTRIHTLGTTIFSKVIELVKLLDKSESVSGRADQQFIVKFLLKTYMPGLYGVTQEKYIPPAPSGETITRAIPLLEKLAAINPDLLANYRKIIREGFDKTNYHTPPNAYIDFILRKLHPELKRVIRMSGLTFRDRIKIGRFLLSS